MPVHIQPTRAYAPAAGGRRVDGILGTGVLSRFLASLVFDTGLAMPGGASVPAAGLLDELGVRPDGPSFSGTGEAERSRSRRSGSARSGQA